MRDWLLLSRAFNVLLSGIAAWTGMVLAHRVWLSPQLILAVLPPVLITAAGNIDNDLCDLGIDKSNKPGRPLVTGRITRKAARTGSVVLAVSGMSISALGGLIPLIIASAVTVLLWLYNRRLSGWPVVGNVVISALGSLPIVFGAVATRLLSSDPDLDVVLIAAVIAFWLHLPREVLKDVLDIEGDRLVRRLTLPQVIGVNKSISGVGLVMLAGLAYVSWSAFCGCFSTLYSVGVMITIAPALLLGAAQCLFAPSELVASRWSLGLKICMVGGLIWMLAGAQVASP